MIFGALIIPVIAFLFLYFFFHKLVWQIIIPLIISLILVFSSKCIVEYVQCQDTEYWAGWMEKATYYEAWTEQCTRVVTDSKGKSHTETYYVYHSPYWTVVDSNSITINISKRKFKELCEKFENKKKVNIFRLNQIGWGGDSYVTYWDKKEKNKEIVSTSHSYQNKILASKSVFRFRDITSDEKKDVFGYPKIENYYDMPSILGYENKNAERKLSLVNAELGKTKQIRIWILVFRDQSLDAAINQENYWQGGNKNELVLNIGIDKEDNVLWGYVFSWTEKEILKSLLKDVINEQKKLNLSKLIDDAKPLIEEHWVRKNFSDFNYLEIEPPWYAVFVTYFLTLIINVVFVIVVVKN